jgi:hypothetical protein
MGTYGSQKNALDSAEKKRKYKPKVAKTTAI